MIKIKQSVDRFATHTVYFLLKLYNGEMPRSWSWLLALLYSKIASYSCVFSAFHCILKFKSVWTTAMQSLVKINEWCKLYLFKFNKLLVAEHHQNQPYCSSVFQNILYLSQFQIYNWKFILISNSLYLHKFSQIIY